MVGDGDVHDTAALVRQDHEHEQDVAVGTTKKSAAAICWTWFARNVRHDYDGDTVGRAMYFAAVAWEMSKPSFRSSP